jgi:Helix-turn-helix domain
LFMNYLLEINAFNEWLEHNHLSTGEIALWYALMHYANKSRWSEWNKVSRLQLQDKTGLSENGVVKARNKLAKFGLIEVKKNGSNKAASIKIISLYYQDSSGTSSDKSDFTTKIVAARYQDSSGTSSDKSDFTTKIVAARYQDSSGTSSASINNKHKQKINSASHLFVVNGKQDQNQEKREPVYGVDFIEPLF